MSRPTLTFIYATVNGNSREATDMLVRDAMRRHYGVRALDCTRADVRELPDTELVIFVLSTTGQGDVPPSFKPYWTFLRRADLCADALQNLRFGVFGLGDSSYAKYNFAAKKLFRRLIQLGASPLLARGDGDDRASDGFDSALVPWATELFVTLDRMFPMPSGLVELSPLDCPPPRYTVRLGRDNDAVGLDSVDVHANRLAQCRPSVSVSVTAMQRLTATTWSQDVRRIAMRGDDALRYATGDVAYVWPAPAIEETRRLLTRLGIEPDTVIAAIEPLNASLTEPLNFPMPCTALQLFSEHFDVLAVPNRFFFSLLSHFAVDERERERLQLFGSTAGRAMRRLYSDDEQRRTADAFEHFASARVPLERLLELVPVLRPRAFSIASAGAASPELALTVAVVDKRTPDGRRHRGRCSAWLASLAVGATVQLHIEPGATTVPPLDTPLLLIGPGTGIALPLALIDERERALQRGGNAAVSRASALFFGNRHRDSDHLYPQLANSPALELYAAVFSRDDKEAPVRYVQHAMRQHAAHVRSLLLERNAHIVLCGNASKMPDDVRNALLRILENGGERSDREAEQILLQLEASGRYQTETWS
jgi:sulfite reductase alpha subunit-like flavoprotein